MQGRVLRPAMLVPLVAMAAVLTGLAVWSRLREESSPQSLAAAILAGDDVRAARIVEAGANPNTMATEVPRGRARASVIVLAVERRLVRTVAALLRARVDLARSVPEPALQAAARANLDDMCALLAGRGAPLDGLGPNGKTALQVAAETGSVRALRMLSRLDHDRTPVRGTGDTLVHLAARSGNADGLGATLADGGALEARNARGETPLIVAARSGRTETLEALILAGANVNAESEGGSALMHAMEREPRAALILIEAGARVASGPEGRGTPLHRAVAYPTVVRALLEKGVRPDERNPEGQTALHLAVEARCLESVRSLLASGASRSAKDRDGRTPDAYLALPRPAGVRADPSDDEAIRRLLAGAKP